MCIFIHENRININLTLTNSSYTTIHCKTPEFKPPHSRGLFIGDSFKLPPNGASLIEDTHFKSRGAVKTISHFENLFLYGPHISDIMSHFATVSSLFLDTS